MKFKSLLVTGALCAASMSAQAALQGRDLDGNALTYEAYYDTVLNMTWLADANLAKTNKFGVSGIGATTGYMSWNTAQSWIAAMNSANYLGISTWRLPHMVDIDNDGCLNNFALNGTDCGYNVVSTGPNASEMASLFYQTLGFLAYYDTNGVPQLPSTGLQYQPQYQANVTAYGNGTYPFTNLGNTLYWYDLATTSNPGGSPDPLPSADNAWYFGMPSGGQRPQDKTLTSPYTAWAVFSGDVAAVPVPGAVWLLGSAIGALGWLRRKAALATAAPKHH